MENEYVLLHEHYTFVTKQNPLLLLLYNIFNQSVSDFEPWAPT